MWIGVPEHGVLLAIECHTNYGRPSIVGILHDEE